MQALIDNLKPLLAVIAVSAGLLGCFGKSEPDSASLLDDPYLRCAQPLSDGEDEAFSLTPLKVEREGNRVIVKGLSQGLVVIGLLAGISEPTSSTLKNIDQFLEQFKDAGVQTIAVAGGVGTEQESVERIVDSLVRAPVPILLTPGDQESLDVFRDVIRKKRKTNPQLLDMTLVRSVKLGDVNIVSIPGYYKPYYLKAGDRGCSFDSKDLESTASFFEERMSNVVLSPTPPRCAGLSSVDRSALGTNIGDPNLTDLLAKNSIRLGLFGYVYEAGGYATRKDGISPVAPGVWEESLFLQAGAAEATAITTLGLGRAAGMAQIVEFSGGRARYRTVFISQ